jgi:porin
MARGWGDMIGRGWARPAYAFLVVAGVIAPPVASSMAEEPAFADKLTGDWAGDRTRLKDKGVEIGVTYTGETFRNMAGGLRRGTSYEGLLDLTLETDLEKLIGWRGAKTHIRAFQIHNAGGLNAADYAGSLADPSNIDAYATTRLFTAWIQQDFGKAGSIRIGQLAADDEFFGSETAGGLLNGTFGWGNTLAANLPSGGPAYPLATPGVRAEFNASESFKILAGVFSGDPAGRNCYRNNPDADPQVCNKHGTTFSFSGGAFWMGEAQYLVNQGEQAKGLAASYKFGGWYHSGSFADQRFEVAHDGNWGLYGVVDQMVWRGRESSVSLFLRGGIVPSDRNLVSWYIDGGIGVKGILPGRAGDTLTFGVAHAHISDDAAAADRDILLLGTPYPIRTGETALELGYKMQVTPWWSVQPDIQYIIRPGGGDPHPDDTTKRIGNAFLVGVRSAIRF